MRQVIGDLIGLALFLGLFFFGVYVSLILLEWIGLIQNVIVWQ